MVPPTNKDKFEFRFSEGSSLAEIEEYIKSTYGQHYVGDHQFQTIDAWDIMGIAREMCMGTAIKYPMRWGKKDGKNRADLLKAIHYLVLALHFTDKEENKEKK